MYKEDEDMMDEDNSTTEEMSDNDDDYEEEFGCSNPFTEEGPSTMSLGAPSMTKHYDSFTSSSSSFYEHQQEALKLVRAESEEFTRPRSLARTISTPVHTGNTQTYSQTQESFFPAFANFNAPSTNCSLATSPQPTESYLDTSPYKTPPKRGNLSASTNSVVTFKPKNLSPKFATGDGTPIARKEKKVFTRDHENVPLNPMHHPLHPNNNPLSRSHPVLPTNSFQFNNTKMTRANTLPILPHTDQCQRITPHTLVDLLQNKFGLRSVILDCRYGFEFEGGHIIGAIHCPPAQSEQILYQTFISNPIKEKIAIIFHCEFSSKRGPTAYNLLRSMDRKINSYPDLTYPEMYVLDGGYKDFFAIFPQLCHPHGYIQMKDKSFKKELAICESERKKSKAKVHKFNSSNANLPLRSSVSFQN